MKPGGWLYDPKPGKKNSFYEVLSGNVCCKWFRKLSLPSGSRSCGMPNLVSARKKASCRFSRLDLLDTCSTSARSGRREWMTAKNALPVRQLGPKSFTSNPKHLKIKITAYEKECVAKNNYLFAEQLILHICYTELTYLVVVRWTHFNNALLAPPGGGRSFLLTGGLVASVLLVELSMEEVLLPWSAGRLIVSSSIWRNREFEWVE